MKLHYNSPVILTYSFICFFITLVYQITQSDLFIHLFIVPSSMDVSQPLDYFRLFSHALGHQSWNHLISNFTLILLLGPPLEERMGSKYILFLTIITALFTGLLNVLFLDTALLGASSVLFMYIILISFVNYDKKSGIPITFLLIVTLYLGRELFNIFLDDKISQFGHIIGGVIGGVFGFLGNPFKKKQSLPKSFMPQDIFPKQPPPVNKTTQDTPTPQNQDDDTTTPQG